MINATDLQVIVLIALPVYARYFTWKRYFFDNYWKETNLRAEKVALPSQSPLENEPEQVNSVNFVGFMYLGFIFFWIVFSRPNE